MRERRDVAQTHTHTQKKKEKYVNPLTQLRKIKHYPLKQGKEISEAKLGRK